TAASRRAPGPRRLRREVLRRVPRLPLDVAADRRLLLGGDGPSREDGVEGRPEVLARHGDAVAGTAVVELAAVDETARAVEQEEVGRARGAVGARHGLVLVVQVRERVPRRAR